MVEEVKKRGAALTAGGSREARVDRQSMVSSVREIHFRNGEWCLSIFSYPPRGRDTHWRGLGRAEPADGRLPLETPRSVATRSLPFSVRMEKNICAKGSGGSVAPCDSEKLAEISWETRGRPREIAATRLMFPSTLHRDRSNARFR